MRTTYYFGILFISLLITTQLNAATDLSSLSSAEQDAISRLCSPVQYREGAAAYRRCVQSETESIKQDGESPLSTLSFDDKYAVQQFCAAAGTDHRRCISDQVSSVRNLPQPSMQNITEDEQYAIQQTCFAAQTNQGLLAYRQCVGNEVASLAQLPRINLENLPILERNALQLRCSANSQSAAAYRQCLSIEYSSFADTAPTYQAPPTAQNTTVAKPAVIEASSPVVELASLDQTTPTSEPSPVTRDVLVSDSPKTEVQNQDTLPVSSPLPRNIDPQRANTAPQPTAQLEQSANLNTTPVSNSSVNTTSEIAEDLIKPVSGPRVISKPTLAEQVQRLETESLNEVQNETSPKIGILDTFKDGLVVAGDKLTALTTLGKVLLATVLALPFIFMFIRQLTHKRSQQASPSWEQNQYEHALPGAIDPQRQSTEAIKARWEDDFLDDDFLDRDNTQRTEPLDLDEPPIAIEDLPTRRVTTDVSQVSSNDETATRFVTRPIAGKVEATLADRWQSGFGSWLDTQPAELRQQYCTEFLIYWMAYSDERYEKELKKEVFTAKDPDQHMLIKRWVLKQDAYAFADSIHWIMNNANRMQREQILDLLMALLVTENSITPSQNIILRILADTFGIGTDALKQRFLFTFSEELPTFPRPDQRNWWLEQSPESIIRWDARASAALPKAEQMMLRLGLSADYKEADVVSAFRRAAKRCHPDRYTQLGDWERSLAQRQYMKFEEARDYLLGVSA